MTARSQHENELIASLESVRDTLPAWTETILFNGAGGPADYEDFGEGWSETVKAPTGYKGKVAGVSIYGITETFANDGGTARVDVGTSSAAQAYYTGGAISDGAAAATPENPAGTVNDFIPGGEDFVVKGVAATDSGTAAGRARAAVTIEWHPE